MAKTILVVEDEDEYRALLQKTLGDAGFEVAAAANGRDGIALCAQRKPDLIMLDVVLPDMLGFEIAKKLRAAGATAPILFCTVRSAAASLLQGVRAGSADYVLKPFDPADLLQRVRAALERGDA